MTSLFRFRRFFLPLLLCWGAPVLPAAAQTAEPPRFLLESIVVEGVQRDAPREIIAAESLLKPGREYTEQELREAVYRVKRLPFVLDAEFSLRRGSERGSYQLVITVEETRLFFYSADLSGGYNGSDDVFRDDQVSWAASATAGARWFVGSQGLVFGSVQAFDEIGLHSGEVGYTRYNLFGRGGFASVSLATNLEEQVGDSTLAFLTLGIPIVGNHSLRLDVGASRTRFESGPFRDESESQAVTLSWIYDTTDDPLFPSTGRRVVGSVGQGFFRDQFEDSLGRTEREGDGQNAAIGIEQIWSLTQRQSIAAELDGGWSRHEDDFGSARTSGYNASLTHSLNPWDFAKTERIGDLRWENKLTVRRDESDSSFTRFDSTDAILSTGLVFRNAFGVIRASFGYLENLEDGQ